MLCSADASLVGRACPALKKLLGLKLSSNDDGRAYSLLAALQFFIHHGAAVSVDWEVQRCHYIS